jgi:hypothetical protein
VFQDRVRRWLYRHGRASRVARCLNAARARLAAAGRAEMAGRGGGHRTPERQDDLVSAVIADYGNERYLVSMLGEGASWVRNVRAAGGPAALRHGDREPPYLRS